MRTYRLHRRWHGFTVVELVVIIAIIGVLVALMLPAVQKVRSAVQRVQCSSNLRQIGIAAYQYHDSRSSFPPGLHLEQDRFLSSWLVDLLPYIEQEEMWRTTQNAYAESLSPFNDPPHVGLATPIPLYSCPADPWSGEIGFARREGIFVAFTSYLGVEGKNLKTRDGVLFAGSHISIEAIIDGTSYTLFAGERPPSADQQFGWWYAGVGQWYSGSCDMILGVEEVNVLPPARAWCPPGPYEFGPGSPDNQCDMFHFWSQHAGGANFLFADGAVHFLTYDVAPLMPALASRGGGETVGLP